MADSLLFPDGFEISEEKKRKTLLVLMGLFVLPIAAIDYASVGALSLSEVFALDIFALLFYFIVLYSCRFFVSIKANRYLVDSKTLMLFVTLALFGGILLEAMTLFGSPAQSVFDVSDWSIKQIGVFSLASYCMVAIFAGSKDDLVGLLGDIRCSINLRNGAIASGVLAASLASGLLFHLALRVSVFPAVAFCFAVYAVLAYLVFTRGSLAVEKVFLVMALSVGGFMACVFPSETGISWDDHIHYERALCLSYGNQSAVSDTDMSLFYAGSDVGPVSMPDVGDGWSESGVQSYSDQMNALYDKGTHAEHPGRVSYEGFSLFSYSVLGYLPSAVGLWLGRFLHLPLTVIFALGRLSNLLLYVFISYLAIKIAPSKKCLLSCIALLPTNLFLASSYSYDPWVTSFSLLAFAFLGRASFAEAKPKSDLFLSGLSFLIAFGPKAIYFPLIGILLLAPKRIFASKRERCTFIVSVIVLGLIVFASFALPFFASGPGAGDSRGGDGVNSAGQVAYIVDNLDSFFAMLVDFLFGFLFNPANSWGYSFAMAYLGSISNIAAFFSAVAPVFIASVAILDVYGSKPPLKLGVPKAWITFLAVLTSALISTALYVSFTPVGLNTINGVQFRYLAPMLFPVYAILFAFPLATKVNESRFTVVCTGAVWLMGLVSIVTLALIYMTV